ERVQVSASVASPAGPVAVIGAGAWGTALAWLLAEKGERVRLWAFETEVAKEIASERENRSYLSGVRLPEALEATNSLGGGVRGVSTMIFVVPSHAAESVLGKLAPAIPPGVPIISATKGIEQNQLRLMTVLLEEILPPHRGPVFALSGPS